MSVSKIIEAIEQAILILIVIMTVGAVMIELATVWNNRTIAIADILLLFLYTEVISMVGVFYRSRQIPVLYPLFIAITALSRLIVLQSKDMAPETILFEAGAIFILGLAALALQSTVVKAQSIGDEPRAPD
ncbi:phosphate-starvation-inducible protein PsiE [Lentisalinibacter salinarum]|uniref:phosphate-starvation-inducible protein PsiE n=1 Tax=Lentisalinibacter salinarum TaxID=2992239 RepID=UPI0038640E6A